LLSSLFVVRCTHFPISCRALWKVCTIAKSHFSR